MAEHLVDRLHSTKVSLLSPYYLVYKFLIPDMERAIHEYGKGDVLDVGCGNKPYQSSFPDTIHSYTGCDVEQSSLRVVDVICPATNLAFKDASFDTVLCTQVLEHVYDHKKAFFEISRVLKPGGCFIGSLPMAWPHHEVPYDFFRFTKFGIEGLAKESGLEIEYIKANGGKWALLGQMIIIAFNEKPQHPGLLSRFKNFIFRITLGKFWVNLVFGNLDRLSSHPNEFNTLNFVFVARKL